MATPPSIDYGRSERPREFRPLVVLAVAVIAAAILLAFFESQTPSRRAVEKARQVRCASNLRQIWQAIYLYTQSNGSAFPPDLQAVFATQQISTEEAVCPSTSDQKATTPAGVAQPGCCSYVYVGADLHWQPNPECVVVIEDPANHDLKGCNVLYADGHVDWVPLPTAMQILNDLAAGKNPPSQTTTFTPATAKQDYEKNWRARMPQMKFGVWKIPPTQATTKPER